MRKYISSPAVVRRTSTLAGDKFAFKVRLFGWVFMGNIMPLDQSKGTKNRRLAYLPPIILNFHMFVHWYRVGVRSAWTPVSHFKAWQEGDTPNEH